MKRRSRLLNITQEEQIILDNMKKEILSKGKIVSTDWYLMDIIRGRKEK